MLRIVLLVLAISICGVVHAGMVFDWAASGGGNINNYTDVVNAVSRDALGNTYVVGNFSGTAYFGSSTLISQDVLDIFVAKLDPAGNWLWARRAGGDSYDNGYGIAADSAGNVYICGAFYGPANFGPFIPATWVSSDIVVAKLDTDGNWLWAASAGGAGPDQATAITCDGNGYCYVTGVFGGTGTFGGTVIESNNYSSDVFVAKLSDTGNWLWASRGGSYASDQGSGICADSSGNIFASGYFRSVATFGSTTLTSVGNRDLFIAKLDANGNWLWARGAGSADTDITYGVSSDGAGNCYATGEFRSTVSFGSYPLTSNGYEDIFIVKLDAGGNWLWARQAGSISTDSGKGIASDGAGNCWVTGHFTGTAQFGATELSSNGADMSDVFVTRLDTDGNWIIALRAGGSQHDYGLAVISGSDGSATLAGYFYSAAHFGTIPLTSYGYNDAFVAHLVTIKPLEPQNLLISRNGDDIQLSWDAVTQDTGGQSVTPVYRVYYSAASPYADYEFLAEVSETSWTHIGAALQTPGFYLVKAEAAD